jgi:hypothetical protein
LFPQKQLHKPRYGPPVPTVSSQKIAQIPDMIARSRGHRRPCVRFFVNNLFSLTKGALL